MKNKITFKEWLKEQGETVYYQKVLDFCAKSNDYMAVIIEKEVLNAHKYNNVCWIPCDVWEDERYEFF